MNVLQTQFWNFSGSDDRERGDVVWCGVRERREEELRERLVMIMKPKTA